MEAIMTIKKLVQSDSKLFNLFLVEGLKFSSSLYLSLIWIRTIKHVFDSPLQITCNISTYS